MKDRQEPAKRRWKHPVLDGRITRILEAFRLKMADLPEAVPYLANNALDLPPDLTSKRIRQIGAAACIYDRSGFSLGDILNWLQQNPNPAISYETFRAMVFKAGLSERTVWNYKSISKSFSADERELGLSRPHHDAVRALPKRERGKLLREAVARGWTDAELRMRGRVRCDELAMPGATDDAANRSLILRSQTRLIFERFQSRVSRVVRLLRKPALSPKDEATLTREMTVLLREFADAKEMFAHSPAASK